MSKEPDLHTQGLDELIEQLADLYDNHRSHRWYPAAVHNIQVAMAIQLLPDQTPRLSQMYVKQGEADKPT